MRTILLFSLALHWPPEHAHDRWFGVDKVKHFAVSALAESVAYSALQAAGVDRGPALATATAATLSLGLGKEWIDRRRGGAVSVRDLTWDAAGAGTASLWLLHARH